MPAIQRVTISVSNNFFICQRILTRFSVDFVFILLCTFLEVDLVLFFFVQRLWKCDIWIAEFRGGQSNRRLIAGLLTFTANVKPLAKFLILQLYYNSFYTSFETC
jgi:hypothetical protein